MYENIAKIIGVTYKLLDFFPEGDPLKNKAKERVLAILERPKLEDIEVLEKYLELAKGIGWVDSMNFLIIKKEWDTLKVGIAPKREILPKEPRHKDIVQKEELFLSGRQQKILTILTKKEKIQVQDIIKEMPDVTKRTIRRDLDNLLKTGKITRIGEFNQVFYQKVR
jgi:DNA-binding transcriptional ArsR family regulator